MDKLSSVTAALDAGKLPTQNQLDAAIDWILKNIVPSVKSPDAGKLSNPGKTLAHDTQYLLMAYKELGDLNNYDNLLQDVLWHLSEGDFAEVRVEAIDTDETSTDLQSICSEIRTFLHILWTIEAGAADNNAILRQIENSARDMAVCPRIRPKDIYYYICDLVQKDKDYQRTLCTLLDIISKWINMSLDTADDMNQSPSLESFINDPSEEKHVLEALRGICTLAERFADWSLEDIFDKARLCTVHARNDRDLNRWLNELFVYVRNGLDEPDYARSEEAQKMHQRLGERWELLVHQDSDTGRMFLDVWDLMIKLHAFHHDITMDNGLQRVRLAHAAFGKYLTLDQASWFWQDVFDVYAPRILRLIKDVTIPRTKYVDDEIAFVLENLNISSLSLLPGHGYIRNTTDGYITAPAGSQSTTATFGTLTHIRMQAVQFVLDEFPFFYRDKLSTVGPRDFMGLMEFILPPKGIDIDLKFRSIPNTPEGLKERERLGRFFKIERVEVTVAEDVAMKFQQCNQPIFTFVFKPVFMLRFREAFSRTLEEQIRGLFDTADVLAFDIGRRSEVFQDAGLGTVSSVVSALWSEIGKLCRMEGGLLSGRRATGTGVVKDELGGNTKTAMGTEPQILPGEKREPPTERIPVGIGGDPEGAKTAVERVEQAGKEGLKQVHSFKQSVEHKKLEEEKGSGWQSSAFDL